MKEVFVIEKMIVVGCWELFSQGYYLDEKVATDAAISVMDLYKSRNQEICLRVTKLNRI